MVVTLQWLVAVEAVRLAMWLFAVVPANRRAVAMSTSAVVGRLVLPRDHCHSDQGLRVDVAAVGPYH
jgi:hypothetical protein